MEQNNIFGVHPSFWYDLHSSSQKYNNIVKGILSSEKEIYVRPDFYYDLQTSEKKYAHIVMIATKPDIVKQAPLYLELKKRGELVILVHTGQHYDYNLSRGVLEEFGMEVDINLNIFGKIHKKFSLVIERLGDLLVEIYEDYHKIPVPYVHGDTMTATTADKAAFLNKFAVVHVEAGIRTFTPSQAFYYDLFENYKDGSFDWDNYYKQLQDFSIYERGSIEPYPEQFDTRGIEGSTGLFAAPVDLYRKTLIDEGFPEEHIKVVGNTAADIVQRSLNNLENSKAFEIYPNMKGKEFVFITIHRRENCETKERFLTIFNAIKKLVQDGVPVCFLGLYASEFAIDRFGLRAELLELVQKYSDTFAYGPALAHHVEAIDMIKNAGVLMTDSGSMQEEANIVGTPCVTVRFGSDRTETILDGTNVIAPPVNAKLIAEIVKGAISNPRMKKEQHLYGENVSEKIVDEVLIMLQEHGKLFKFDHERLHLSKFFDWEIY